MNKKLIKRIERECSFCKEDLLDVLDCHRIKHGSDGGKYTKGNIVVCCANCHRKCHSGNIQILGKHLSTSGRYVVHYLEDNIEKFS